ncbi:hypothetical protein OK351_11535 [Glutamicibacter sp. MNS18]|uniref:hypothetical protein n=1 Tax=Glutamicibacter sp. MNS18 TaxID=2989817 RepID=UPI002235D5FE|nr:hypothetical protein [Glutamicibacter sp. MNS18]MCW4466130.1 hypothetical protein [Glutamicibacter sp. MNS18]
MDAVFGSTRTGETTYTRDLLRSLDPSMIILGDRNFAAAVLLHKIHATGAHYLVRVENGRRLPVHSALADGSYLSDLGGSVVRVITATITLITDQEHHTDRYTLVTSLLDTNEGSAHRLRYWPRTTQRANSKPVQASPEPTLPVRLTIQLTPATTLTEPSAK